MRIVVAGGGSGGHITPILAVAEVLKSSDNQIDYIGIGEQRERDLLKNRGITPHRIMAGKFRRYPSRTFVQQLLDVRTPLLNLRDSLRVVIGFLQSFVLLVRLRPHRVFVKGGYVGVPVGLAAWCLRIPLIIHESDSVPGLANRILSRFTQHRISGFPLPGFVNLGNPVRPELLEEDGRDVASLGVKPNKPIVLAFGGSLGSNILNTSVIQLAKATDRFEIIHITGGNAGEKVSLDHYHDFPFLVSEMATALQSADIVIARAGANTLAELAILGKAGIIIPHPDLSGNHQLRNAEVMAAHSAVVLLPQDELSKGRLLEEVLRLIDDPEEMKQLRQNIVAFARPEAAKSIAAAIIHLGEGSEESQ